MALRAIEGNWYRNMLFHLDNTKQQYDKYISQTTSGKKLNTLSDNPPDMAYVLSLRSKMDQIDQFTRNIDSAEGFLNTAESALNQVQNLMYKVTNLASQGASDTTDAEGRGLIATEIEDIRENIMDLANTEIMGKYIFAGSATDTAPFRVDDVTLPAPPAGRPWPIVYDGNADYIEIQAEFSITVETNIPGSEVFGTGAGGPPPVDIFEEMATMIENLRNDDALAVGTQTANLNLIITQIGEAMGDLGNRNAHLDTIKGNLKSFKTAIMDKKSSLEDADMAEAITKLSMSEVAMQATMQAGARIQSFTLMNYIG